nr:hypothetical protein TorRG33x02_147160 [Ipomoea batatas]
MVPKVVAKMVVPMMVTTMASQRSRSPTTTNDSAKNATEMSTHASHISLLMIAIICFFALLSITTTDVCTTTTARDMNSAMESNTKKIMNDAFGAMLASPSDVPGGISSGSFTYCPGTVNMAANATVAISTATTVVEFMALFSPSVCILFRRFAIPWMRLLVCFVCSNCMASVSPCPIFSAVSKAVSPDLFNALLNAKLFFHCFWLWLPGCPLAPTDNPPPLCALASPPCVTPSSTYKAVSPAEFCFISISAASSSSSPVLLTISIIAAMFPALAAECKTVSSRFPVSCFVIFFRVDTAGYGVSAALSIMSY